MVMAMAMMTMITVYISCKQTYEYLLTFLNENVVKSPPLHVCNGLLRLPCGRVNDGTGQISGRRDGQRVLVKHDASGAVLRITCGCLMIITNILAVLITPPRLAELCFRSFRVSRPFCMRAG